MPTPTTSWGLELTTDGTTTPGINVVAQPRQQSINQFRSWPCCWFLKPSATARPEGRQIRAATAGVKSSTVIFFSDLSPRIGAPPVTFAAYSNIIICLKIETVDVSSRRKMMPRALTPRQRAIVGRQAVEGVFTVFDRATRSDLLKVVGGENVIGAGLHSLPCRWPCRTPDGGDGVVSTSRSSPSCRCR